MSDTTYTQKIFSVDVLPEVDGFSNVIARVRWEYRARSGVNVVWSVHTTDLEVPTEETFVSFEDITESMVFDWIAQQVDLEQLRQDLDMQLQASSVSFVEKDPPWETFGDNVLTRPYVIVQDESIVWGPSRWNTAEINHELSKLGLSVVLPNVIPIIPETEPLIVGTDTSIYRVNMLEPSSSRLIDQTIYDIGETTWDFSTGIAVGQIQYNLKSLEDLKTSLISWLKAKRLLSNYKPMQNTMFDEITQLLKMSTFALSSDDPIEWLDTDDMTIKTMSRNEFQDQIDSVVNEEKLADQETASRVSEVNNATTTQEVLDLYNQWN